jgi:hypothetical protein
MGCQSLSLVSNTDFLNSDVTSQPILSLAVDTLRERIRDTNAAAHDSLCLPQEDMTQNFSTIVKNKVIIISYLMSNLGIDF